jgi:CMP-N-acetylneuraminic acid synthetase
MVDDKTVLGIIPARGGSKGVLRKNIRLLAGKPLIAYAIEVGLKSPSVDRVIVTTDDEEIAAIAREYGAEVPFMRPSELAGDSVPDKPVFQHVLNELKETESYHPDVLLNLRCTTPFKTVDDVESVVEKLVGSDCDSVRTMTSVEGVFHPYWMFKEQDGYAQPFLTGIDTEKNYQRQLLPSLYRLNGVVDGLKSVNLLSSGSFWGDRMGIVEVPEERAFDIDTEFELRVANLIMENQ